MSTPLSTSMWACMTTKRCKATQQLLAQNGNKNKLVKKKKKTLSRNNFFFTLFLFMFIFQMDFVDGGWWYCGLDKYEEKIVHGSYKYHAMSKMYSQAFSFVLVQFTNYTFSIKHFYVWGHCLDEMWFFVGIFLLYF